MKNLTFNFIGVYADGSMSPQDKAMQGKIQKNANAQKITGTALHSAAGIASAFGPIGAIVGAGLELTNGIYQGVEGAMQKKRAESIAAPEVDPTQVSMLDTMKRLRLGYQTGAEASVYKNIINQGLDNSIKGVTAYSGGATGNMIGAISNSQDQAMNAYNNIAATLEKNRIGVLEMESKATDNIAQRKLDVQQAHSIQGQSDAYGNMKAGKQDILGGLTNAALSAFDKNTSSDADDEDGNNILAILKKFGSGGKSGGYSGAMDASSPGGGGSSGGGGSTGGGASGSGAGGSAGGGG